MAKESWIFDQNVKYLVYRRNTIPERKVINDVADLKYKSFTMLIQDSSV